MADRYTNCESVYQFAKELCKEKETGAYAKGYNNALRAIMSAARSEALPSADVVEVVRCKDCKHWIAGHISTFGIYYPSKCVLCRDARSSGAFCSYGERRGNDED